MSNEKKMDESSLDLFTTSKPACVFVCHSDIWFINYYKTSNVLCLVYLLAQKKKIKFFALSVSVLITKTKYQYFYTQLPDRFGLWLLPFVRHPGYCEQK